MINEEDLHIISSYFCKNYKSNPGIHLDGVWFFLTVMNGDRSVEKSIKAKINHLKVLTFTTGTTTFQYMKRRVISGKTGRHGVKNAYSVIPYADETDAEQPFTVIKVS